MAEKNGEKGEKNVKIIGRREKQRGTGEGRNLRFWLKIITNFCRFLG